MEINTKKTDVGIIVGRFQVHELHDGHKNLFKTVINNHAKVICFLGVGRIKGTKNNPLDFEARKQMILTDYPNITVLPIEDMRNDEDWSKNLDDKIETVISPMQTVSLYGSRDSFGPSYSGRHKKNVIELIASSIISGTKIRHEIRNKVIPNSDFRAGAIWATSLHYPAVQPTVDVAIYDRAAKQFLFAKKPNENKLRFVGGFVSPHDDSYEVAASREATEETNLALEITGYICSKIIDDWRYRSEQDRIMTSFYFAERLYGNALAQDDIEYLTWIPIRQLKSEEFVEEMMEEHIPLYHALIKYLAK